MDKTIVKQHYVEIDVYKGLAILSIIFGHSFCSFPIDFRETSLIEGQHLFATFSLNMFFLASGVLFSVNESWGDFFKKKLNRLMLPWLTFTIIALVLKKVMAGFVHHQASSVGHELLMDVVYGKSYWFLYALFLMMVVTKLLKDRRVLALLGGAFLLFLPLSQHIPSMYNILCAERVIHYYPWFLMGFLIKDRYAVISETVKKLPNRAITIGSLLLAAMVVMVISEVSRIYVFKYYLMPVLGCVSFYLMACYVCEKRFFERVTTFFGKYSLQYYLNHLLIMLVCYYIGAQIFVFSPLASLMVIFLMALIISTLMLWIEKKMPKPIRYLFGFL